MLRRLNPLPSGVQEVTIKGEQVSVPADLGKYVEHHWTDFARWNKENRKAFIPLLTEGYQAFNELVAYDLAEFDYEKFVAEVGKLSDKITVKLDNLEKSINQRRGKEVDRGLRRLDQGNQEDRQNSTQQNNDKLKLEYANRDQVNISAENFQGLVKNVLPEYLYLKGLHGKIQNFKKTLNSDKEKFRRQLDREKATGRVNHRDDVSYDPSIHDYAIPPEYTHPYSNYDHISHAGLYFAITTIYPQIESVLNITQDYLSTQRWFWATPSTRRFIVEYGKFLEDKQTEVRQAKQGLAQSAYDRLTRDLIDEETLPRETFAAFANFVKENGNFSTVVLERSQLNHALKYVRDRQKQLQKSKPRFGIFRPNLMKKYHQQKNLLASVEQSLESYNRDTRALVDRLKASSNNGNDPLAKSFDELLILFNAQQFEGQAQEAGTIINRTNVSDSLLERAVTQENPQGTYDNLIKFDTFLEDQEKELQEKVRNTGWFRRIFGKTTYNRRKNQLAFIRQFRAAAQVTLSNRETVDSTQRIKIVIDNDKMKRFVDEYNAHRVKDKIHVLHAGTSVQLMEERIYYDREMEKNYQSILKDNQLFNRVIFLYNRYRSEKKLSRIESSLDANSQLNQIRKNGDFSKFVDSHRGKVEEQYHGFDEISTELQNIFRPNFPNDGGETQEKAFLRNRLIANDSWCQEVLVAYNRYCVAHGLTPFNPEEVQEAEEARERLNVDSSGSAESNPAELQVQESAIVTRKKRFFAKISEIEPADIDDLLKSVQTRVKEKNQQFDEYLVSIKIQLEASVEDRFLDLVREYNQYLREENQGITNETDEEKPFASISVQDFISCPTNDEQAAKDRNARHKAYEIIRKHKNFGNFVANYKAKLKDEQFKDITDRKRNFVHYLECFARDIEDPTRSLNVRLNERVKDAYDRFSDLIVYHGINEDNIKQAIRYIDLITYAITSWAREAKNSELRAQHPPIEVSTINLCDAEARASFLMGLKIARKIIKGEKVDKRLNGIGQFTPESTQSINLVLPREKFEDTTHGSVQSLLVMRYSRWHLRQLFRLSELKQTEIDQNNQLYAGVSDTINLIKNHTILDIEDTYKRIASDALSYFRRMFFQVNTGEQNGEPHIHPSKLVQFAKTNTHGRSADGFDSYLTFKDGAQPRSEKDLEILKNNLEVKKNTPKKTRGVCRLNDACYEWDKPTIKALLARLNYKENYISKLRNEIIASYLEALENEMNTVSPEDMLETHKLLLAALRNYTFVFTIICTQEELRRVAKIIFGIKFNPNYESISLEKEFKEFYCENESFIAGEVHSIIGGYIKNTPEHQFNIRTADSIFSIGSHENKEDYALKRVNDLLARAKRATNRFYDPGVREFTCYLDSQGFSRFNQRKIKECFNTYTPESTENFWSYTHDELAARYYTNGDGNRYLQTIRLAQIKAFLYNRSFSLQSDTQYIKTFHQQVTKYRHRSIFPADSQGAQTALSLMFEEYFDGEFYKSLDAQHTLYALANAECLALYFNTDGRWLDKIRLMRLAFVFARESEYDADSFIKDIKESPVDRPFPCTAEGKVSFKQTLLEVFVDDAESVIERYAFNTNVKKLALAYDTEREVLDLIRLAEIIHCDTLATEKSIEPIKYIDQFIGELRNTEGNNQFPKTQLGRQELNAYFEAKIFPHGREECIKTRCQYDPVVESVALAFDTDRQYVDFIRIARIARLIEEGGTVVEPHQFATNVASSGIKFPQHGKSKEYLKALFFAYLYPTEQGRNEPNIEERYGYSPITEFFVYKWGDQDTKEKCLLARVAHIFKHVDSSEDPLGDIYINAIETHDAQEENNKVLQTLHSLGASNVKELNEILAFYVQDPNKNWNPEIEKLIKFFEPEENNSKYLKAYRLKRLRELFNNEGRELHQEEYNRYQEMLGKEGVASYRNLQSFFGDDEAQLKALKSIFQAYLEESISLCRDLDSFQKASIKDATRFNLAILLISERILGGLTIPDSEKFDGIKIDSEEIKGKPLYHVWSSLIRMFKKLERVNKAIEETRSFLQAQAYTKALNQYKQYHQDEQNDSNPDRDVVNLDAKTRMGIAEAAAEVAKDHAGYQADIEEIQQQVKEKARAISQATELNELRGLVDELIKIFETQVPKFASAKLRNPLAMLQAQHQQLTRNMITSRGSSDRSAAPELLEFIRLIPNEPKNFRENCIQQVKKFYIKMSDPDANTAEVRNISEAIVIYFHLLLENTTQNRMARKFKDYLGPTLDLSGLTFDHNDVLSPINTYLMNNNEVDEITSNHGLVKDRLKTILTILKSEHEIQPLVPELIQVVEQLSDDEEVTTHIYKTLSLAFGEDYQQKILPIIDLLEAESKSRDDVEAGIKSRIEQDTEIAAVLINAGYQGLDQISQILGDRNAKNNILASFIVKYGTKARRNITNAEGTSHVIVGLLELLNQQRLANQLSAFSSIVSQLNNQLEHNKEVLKALIAKYGETLKLPDVDIRELQDALEEFKEGEMGDRFAQQERRVKFAIVELFESQVRLTKAKTDEDFIEAIKKFINLVNEARFYRRQQAVAQELNRARDNKAMQDCLRKTNQEQEIRNIKSITASLLGLDEPGYITSLIEEMKSDFVDNLPGGENEVKVAVDYVSENVNDINNAYKNVLTTMQALAADTTFTICLANLTLADFNFLREGLDKNRKAILKALISDLITQEGEHNTPYREYLLVMKDYINNDFGFTATEEAIKKLQEKQESFIHYAAKLQWVKENIEQLNAEQYQELDIDKTTQTLHGFSNDLAETDRRALNVLITENGVELAQDVCNFLKASISPEQEQEYAEAGGERINANNTILKRFKAFQAVINKVNRCLDYSAAYGAHKENDVTEEEIGIILAECQDNESNDVREQMKLSLQQSIEQLLQDDGAYYKTFRQLILNAGTPEQKNTMFEANYKAIIDCFRLRYLQLYKNNKENFSENFLSEDEIADLRYIIEGYTGTQDIGGNLKSQINNLIEHFETLISEKLEALKRKSSLNAQQQAKSQATQHLLVLVRYGSSAIKTFGPKEQQSKLQYLTKIVECINTIVGIIQGTKSPYGFYRFFNELAGLGYFSNDDGNGNIYSDLLCQHLKDMTQYLSEKFSSGSLQIGLMQAVSKDSGVTRYTSLHYIFEQLLNFNNKALRNVDLSGTNFLKKIAVLYSYAQLPSLNGAGTAKTKISDYVDNLLQSFVADYIAFRTRAINNFSEDPKEGSVPCGSKYALGIIATLGDKAMVEQVRICDGTFKKHLAASDLAEKYIGFLNNVSKANFSCVNQDTIIRNFVEKINNDKELETTIFRRFIDRLNNLLPEHVQELNIDTDSEISVEKVRAELKNLMKRAAHTYYTISQAKEFKHSLVLILATTDASDMMSKKDALVQKVGRLKIGKEDFNVFIDMFNNSPNISSQKLTIKWDEEVTLDTIKRKLKQLIETEVSAKRTLITRSCSNGRGGEPCARQSLSATGN